MAGATALTLGTATNGVIEIAGDEDFFSIDLVAGQAYDFRTDPDAADTVLVLLDPSGAQLRINDDIQYPQQVNSLIDQFLAPADPLDHELAIPILVG